MCLPAGVMGVRHAKAWTRHTSKHSLSLSLSLSLFPLPLSPPFFTHPHPHPHPHMHTHTHTLTCTHTHTPQPCHFLVTRALTGLCRPRVALQALPLKTISCTAALPCTQPCTCSPRPSAYTSCTHAHHVPLPAHMLTTSLCLHTCMYACPQLYALGVPQGHFTHVFLDEAGHAEEPLALCTISGLLAPDAR